MKNFYKLLLFTFISTSITAQYHIGDKYGGGIIYDIICSLNAQHQVFLEQIKIVQSQDSYFSNITQAQQYANNQEILNGWTTQTFLEMHNMWSNRDILIHSHYFNDFNTDYFYLTSTELGLFISIR